jgi:hypothetical protein
MASTFHGQKTDYILEGGQEERERWHNLKYYTWVEQQGKTYDEIQAQWFDDDYWTGIVDSVDEIDALITEFNQRTGLLSS